jgi:hypothetical protein
MTRQSVAVLSHFFVRGPRGTAMPTALLSTWKLLEPCAATKPAYRKRHRRVRAAERKARLRERSIAAGLSRSKRSARRATLPLDIGPALIVILLLSLGLWG